VHAHESERNRPACEGDGHEKHGVEEHEEDKQRVRRTPGAESGAAQGEDCERGTAGARGRQQPGGGRPGQRELSALPHSDAARGVAGDEREQQDIAAEGDALACDPSHGPGRADRQRAAKNMGERVHASTGEHDQGQKSDTDERWNEGPARQGFEVHGGESQLSRERSVRGGLVRDEHGLLHLYGRDGRIGCDKCRGRWR